jgi:hypothetical protein
MGDEKAAVHKGFTKNKGGDNLCRDDFDAGPSSFDVIEPGLLLGLQNQFYFFIHNEKLLRLFNLMRG